MVESHLLAFVGRPAKLWEEANPDWAPTLLLGYEARHEGTARYERAARRRFQRTAPEMDADTAAAAGASGVAATPPENHCDGGGDDSAYAEDSRSLPRADCQVQAASENESGTSLA